MGSIFCGAGTNGLDLGLIVEWFSPQLGLKAIYSFLYCNNVFTFLYLHDIIELMKIQGFSWDKGNIEKVQKHGLSIEEIEDRLLFVVFTLRAVDGVLKARVISARYAHKKEWEKFYGKI